MHVTLKEVRAGNVAQPGGRPQQQWVRRVEHSFADIVIVISSTGTVEHDKGCVALPPLAQQSPKTGDVEYPSLGHQSKRCKCKVRCLHCSRRHASWVCNPYWGKAGRDLQEETAPKEVATTNVHASAKRETNDEVALQTFRSWAVREKKCVYIRGVLDEGSQKTFIREDVSKTFNLWVLGRKDYHLSTFGNDSWKD
ncbi:hypothetical protein HPB48_002306 [Haemaphysalis longicornis]|uniref:Uncharacterized protein n=1 Tax=Haemaphysalis longicornis TaxID=44386 RepID=A0A9J6GJW7_HAELO|nr:hypothetical protein HPB48_002306 [Haemaphysalis longicornis]